jgi:hypothetical protein
VGALKWDEFRVAYPKEATAIQNHLEDCSLDEDETIDRFNFEVKSGIVKAHGPNDLVERIPPLWYMPAGYCTGDPNEEETKAINEAGFQYDWMDYLDFPADDIFEEDAAGCEGAVDLN